MKYLVAIISVFLFVQAMALPLSCEGYDTKSDELYIRGSGYATDPDSITAYRKATLIARQRIAAQISTKINSATEIYLHSISGRDSVEYRSVMNFHTANISNQLFVSSTPFCEKIQRKGDCQFEASVAMEVPIESLLNLIEREKNDEIDWQKYRDIVFKLTN